MHAARGGAAYIGPRRGGLRIRREERLHHRHRGAVHSGAVKGRKPVLCVVSSIDERRRVSDEAAGADVKDTGCSQALYAEGEGR